MNIIKVICKNNALPRVRRHMSFCTCVKSRDLLKVPKCLIAVVLADVDLPHWTLNPDLPIHYTTFIGLR